MKTNEVFKGLRAMMKMALCLAALAVATGCQTRITAEKNPEQLMPIQKVVTVDGKEQIITTDAIRASGGWYATARSPLWATEELRGLQIGVATNGTVSLALDAYNRDLSTNAVTMAHNLVTDFALLAEKAAAAYATCGASLAASAGKKAVQKAIAKYIARGGSADAAKVRAEGGNLVFSDGLVTEVCENCLVTEVEN